MIRAGMVTYPGLPGPQISPYMTREASREHYAPGTEFAIDQLTLIGNTGTYLDAPYHRYPDGADLSAIALTSAVDLPAVVVRVTGARQPGIDVGALAAHDVQGKAVLLHTGDDTRFGTPAYATERHFLTRAGAAGSPPAAPYSSASTGSTSMTPTTANGPHTRCCSPPVFPSSSI